MIGDGVIAESYASFKITWENPGNGAQPTWDQNAQYIELHTVDLYPDLEYTQASALATYYKYTSAEKLIDLIKRINQIIDSKLIGAKPANETLALPPASEKPKTTDSNEDPGEPEGSKEQDEVTNDEPKKDEPVGPEKTLSYRVTVIADRLRFIDVQGQRGGGITIAHKLSNNITKVVGDETLDNSAKIKAEIATGGLLSNKIELGIEDFETESGENLLVQIIPSLELVFTAGQAAVVPTGKETEDEDWLIKALKGLKGTGAKEREYYDVNAKVRKESEQQSAEPNVTTKQV